MSVVSLQIAGETYRITAEERDIPHIRALAAQLDERVLAVAKSAPKADRSTVLIMLLLILQDELQEKGKARPAINLAVGDVDFSPLAASISELAAQIQKIAGSLK